MVCTAQKKAGIAALRNQFVFGISQKDYIYPSKYL
jgi:hypothetical protein